MSTDSTLPQINKYLNAILKGIFAINQNINKTAYTTKHNSCLIMMRKRLNSVKSVYFTNILYNI